MHPEKLVSVQVAPKTLCCSCLRSFRLLSSGQAKWPNNIMSVTSLQPRSAMLTMAHVTHEKIYAHRLEVASRNMVVV